jgi:hypothetical protein
MGFAPWLRCPINRLKLDKVPPSGSVLNEGYRFLLALQPPASDQAAFVVQRMIINSLRGKLPKYSFEPLRCRYLNMRAV